MKICRNKKLNAIFIALLFSIVAITTGCENKTNNNSDSSNNTSSSSTSSTYEEQSEKEAEEQAKKEAEEQAKKEAEEQAKKEAEKRAKTNITQKSNSNNSNGKVVYNSTYGKKYHYDPDCAGKNPKSMTEAQAKAQGLKPCGKCVH